MNRSLSSSIPDFITLAEASLRRRPEITEDTYDTLTVPADAEIVNLPSDCNILTEIYFDESGDRYAIESKPLSFMAAEKARNLDSTGRPRYHAIVGHGTKVKFSPVPDQAYTPIIHYQTQLPSLSASAPTNWLLLAHPDVYLYAALVQSAPFLKDDERIGVWSSLLEKALREVKEFEQRRNWSAGSLIRRPRRAIG